MGTISQMQTWAPGSILRVWSRRHGVFHWGVSDWPDWTGVRVIHSAKGSFVRSTTLQEFAEGELIEIVWVPQNSAQQAAFLERMHSLEGKPYDLLTANCEHVVSWALTGRSQSPQLALGFLLLIGVAALAAATAHSA